MEMSMINTRQDNLLRIFINFWFGLTTIGRTIPAIVTISLVIVITFYYFYSHKSKII